MHKTKIDEQEWDSIDYEERRNAVAQRKRDKRRKKELRRQERKSFMETSNGN
jgi:hypothetical protein